MKKYLSLVMVLLLITGCNTKKNVQSLSIKNMYTYIAVGESYQLKATSSSDQDTMIYQSKNKDIATVSSTGSIKGMKQGKTTISVQSKSNPKLTKTISIQVYPLKDAKFTRNEKWKWTYAFDVNAYIAKKTRLTKEAVKNRVLVACFDYLGIPYSQEVRTGNSMDCSSYLRTIYLKLFKIDIGNYTRAQAYTLWDYKKSFNQRQVGDLLYAINDAQERHITLYLGNNRMIHASLTLNGVSVSSIYYGPFKNA